MQVWSMLHAARWKYRTQKIAKKSPLGTIPQLCRAISSQLRHVSTIGKNVLSSNISSTCSPQYRELRPTSGWDRFVSLGNPCKFQWVSRLGSVTARHSGTGRQPNFAALNRGRHLYSSGRPSRWALAHISSYTFYDFRDFVDSYTFIAMCTWPWCIRNVLTSTQNVALIESLFYVYWLNAKNFTLHRLKFASAFM